LVRGELNDCLIKRLPLTVYPDHAREWRLVDRLPNKAAAERAEQRIGRCHRYGQRLDVEVMNFLNRRNAADQRVLELIQHKLHLFDGVFGASDQVLGRIEAGIDFEKRIAEIFDCCRTPQEIAAAFASLRAKLDADYRHSPDGRARRANMGQAGKDRCKPAH
jgi:hypothetical protein